MANTATSEPFPILISGPEVARRIGVSLPTWKRMKKHFTCIRIPGCDPKFSWPVVQEELSRYIELAKEKSNA